MVDENEMILIVVFGLFFANILDEFDRGGGVENKPLFSFLMFFLMFFSCILTKYTWLGTKIKVICCKHTPLFDYFLPNRLDGFDKKGEGQNFFLIKIVF